MPDDATLSALTCETAISVSLVRYGVRVFVPSSQARPPASRQIDTARFVPQSLAPRVDRNQRLHGLQEIVQRGCAGGFAGSFRLRQRTVHKNAGGIGGNLAFEPRFPIFGLPLEEAIGRIFQSVDKDSQVLASATYALDGDANAPAPMQAETATMASSPLPLRNQSPELFMFFTSLLRIEARAPILSASRVSESPIDEQSGNLFVNIRKVRVVT